MLDQKELTINGEQWVIQQLPASRGMQVAVYLLKVAAGSSAGVGFIPANDLMETPINPGELIAGLIRQLDVVDSPAFIKRLVLDSVIRPVIKEDDFESRFSGNYDVLWELMTQIILHNNYQEVLKKRVLDIIQNLFFTEQSQGKFTPSTKGRS